MQIFTIMTFVLSVCLKQQLQWIPYYMLKTSGKISNLLINKHEVKRNKTIHQQKELAQLLSGVFMRIGWNMNCHYFSIAAIINYHKLIIWTQLTILPLHSIEILTRVLTGIVMVFLLEALRENPFIFLVLQAICIPWLIVPLPPLLNPAAFGWILISHHYELLFCLPLPLWRIHTYWAHPDNPG